MDFRLSPFSFPSSPKQLVKIFMNGELLSELELEEGWQTYSFDLPRSYLREGSQQHPLPVPLYRFPCAGDPWEQQIRAVWRWPSITLPFSRNEKGTLLHAGMCH